MQTYNAIVRLNGDVTQEVPKHGITAAEVVMLRHIHGTDSVVREIKSGSVSIGLEELHEKLVRKHGRNVVEACFGAGAATRLPVSIDGNYKAPVGTNDQSEELATLRGQLARLEAALAALTGASAPAEPEPKPAAPAAGQAYFPDDEPDEEEDEEPVELEVEDEALGDYEEAAAEPAPAPKPTPKPAAPAKRSFKKKA